MKKNIFIKIGIGIIIIIGGWIICSNIVEQSSIQKEVGSLSVQDSVEKEIVLIIDNGEEEPQIFKAEGKEGITAFDLLKNKAEESGLVLKTKTYDIGVMIEAIGEKENGQDGKYWLYYVNGEMASVSADKEEIKPGDEIEFKFEKSPF